MTIETKNERDLIGRVFKTIDPLGNESQTVYDESGNVARTIDANGGVTAFTYDANGRLLTLTDPVGNTTSHEYNAQGQLIKETNELGKSRHFEYLGQWLVRKTDRNGRVTEYVYDRFGRMKEERWLEGSHLVNTIVNEYNEVGDLAGVNDNMVMFVYEYNSQRRETKSTAKFDGLERDVVLRSEYDKRGQQILSVMDEFSTRYTYTPTRQTESIVRGNQSVTYTYDAAGQRNSAQTPATNTAYTYDGMGRITMIDHQGITCYNYTWDAVSRIVSINDGKYGYDKTNQLLSANYAQLPAEKYEYDLNGNRLNFRTGPNNQLLHDGKFAYIYDDEGNRIAKDATKYFWDHRNRLVKVETPEETVEYSYDHRNRLVWRASANGVEYFVHDGWQIVMVLDGNGTVKERYLWGAKQDELIAADGYYAQGDHLGTVRNLADANGQVVSRLEYNAFGESVSSTGPKPRFRYTGKLFDDATSLQWNINRWYDVQIGRWASEDPIGFRGRDTNLVRYASNDPLDQVDLFGLAAAPCCKSNTPERYCCSTGLGFEQVFVILGFTDPYHCVLDALSGVWWYDLMVGFSLGVGATGTDALVAYVTQKGFAAHGPFFATYSIGIALAIHTAYDTCLAWQCQQRRTAPCRCTAVGLILDPWLCECPNTDDMILSDYGQMFYTAGPPTGGGSETIWMSRWW